MLKLVCRLYKIIQSVYRNKSISFKQYLFMLVGVCMASLVQWTNYELLLYPTDACNYLSVDPEAVEILELPAETEVSMCAVSIF